MPLLTHPPRLHQMRLKLSLALHSGQTYWLKSCGPVTQPASISRSLCRKENEFQSYRNENMWNPIREISWRW